MATLVNQKIRGYSKKGTGGKFKNGFFRGRLKSNPKKGGGGKQKKNEWGGVGETKLCRQKDLKRCNQIMATRIRPWRQKTTAEQSEIFSSFMKKKTEQPGTVKPSKKGGKKSSTRTFHKRITSQILGVPEKGERSTKAHRN